MKHLILHVGITKTGTTSLQRFFHYNREQFKNLGFNYPTFRKNSTKEEFGKNAVFLLCKLVNRASLIHSGLYKKTYEDEYNSHLLVNLFDENDTTILSDEGFHYIDIKNNKSFKENRRTIYKELSDYLVENNIDKVTFVVYLRTQFEHIASQWKQDIKQKKTDSFRSFLKNKYAEYICDHYAFIKTMEECIDIPHEIIVRIYDRNNFVGGDIYHDFADAIGMPWNDDFVIPESERNLSFTYDIAEALRTINPCISRKNRSKVIKHIRELSIENPDPKGLTPFTKEEIKEYMKQYEEGNREIARKYFMRDQLFPEIDYDNVITWIPDDDKIKKYRKELLKVCPFYTRMLANLYSVDFIRDITPRFIKKFIGRILVYI